MKQAIIYLSFIIYSMVSFAQNENMYFCHGIVCIKVDQIKSKNHFLNCKKNIATEFIIKRNSLAKSDIITRFEGIKMIDATYTYNLSLYSNKIDTLNNYISKVSYNYNGYEILGYIYKNGGKYKKGMIIIIIDNTTIILSLKNVTDSKGKRVRKNISEENMTFLSNIKIKSKDTFQLFCPPSKKNIRCKIS